jgi:2-dehydro-3-deoxygluconokinase
MTAQLVTIGETLAALTSRSLVPLRHARSFHLGIGGAESNAAIGANRLGVPTAWIGRVGADEFGRLINQTLRGEGVDARAIVDAHRPTAVMIKTHRSSENVEVAYYRAGSAGSALSPDDIDEALITGAQVLHISGITCAISPSARATVHHAIEVAHEAGVTVSVDFNYRQALWSPEQAAEEYRLLAKSADIVLAAAHEAQIVVGNGAPQDQLERLAGLGPNEIIIKLGPDGAIGRSSGRTHFAPPIPVTAVDTIGAGDAFAAGYLASRIDGADFDQCMNVAARVGAFAVTVHGDWEGLPTRAELDRHHIDSVNR